MQQRKRLIVVILVLTMLLVGNMVVLYHNNNTLKEVTVKVELMELDKENMNNKNTQTIKALSEEINNVRSVQKQTELRQLENTSRGSIDRGSRKNITKLTKTTDLCQKVNINANDMNRIIDDWDSHTKNGTPFKNKGDVFIRASEETGLNPVYILAHAAWESNWGKSTIAKSRNNYFGINAVDSNPGRAYAMGDSLDDGIIAGAKWIKQEYYNSGHTSLNSMIYNNGRGAYASDADKWIDGITSIVNTSYRIL